MENNILFDLARIKCEIYFLNKSSKYDDTEKIKSLLENEYSSISMKMENSKRSSSPKKKDKNKDDEKAQEKKDKEETKTLFIQYYEKGETVNDNMLILSK